MVKKYRTKPVTIEAVIFTGRYEDVISLIKWSDGKIHFNQEDLLSGVGLVRHLYINTLEGTMVASVNDYIVRGLEGEFYPVKPSIFNKKYEEVMERP